MPVVVFSHHSGKRLRLRLISRLENDVATEKNQQGEFNVGATGFPERRTISGLRRACDMP
jgi:hypothetical protein